MKLDELLKAYVSICKDIRKLLDVSGYIKYEDFLDVEFDRGDQDQRFVADRLLIASNCLVTAFNVVEYLDREIVGEYTLSLDASGRPYCSGREYYCGFSIEYLARNPEYDPDYGDSEFVWKLSHIEHDGNSYYIAAEPELDLSGLTVRVRASYSSLSD